MSTNGPTPRETCVVKRDDIQQRFAHSENHLMRAVMLVTREPIAEAFSLPALEKAVEANLALKFPGKDISEIEWELEVPMADG